MTIQIFRRSKICDIPVRKIQDRDDVTLASVQTVADLIYQKKKKKN